MKVNTSHIVRALTKVCIFLKRSVPSEGNSNILYNSPLYPILNMCLHWPLYQVGKEEEQKKAIDFSEQVLDVPVDCVLVYAVITAPLCNVCPTL